MTAKKAALIVMMITLTIASYSYGYYISYQSNLSEKYDDLHLNLTGELMIYDAIINGNGELAVPVILSMISSEFAKMAELYSIGQTEKSKLVRCAVTRKMRVLKDKGIVFSGKTAETDWGSKLILVEEYLASECLGEPSHDDWSEPDRKSRENQLKNDGVRFGT